MNAPEINCGETNHYQGLDTLKVMLAILVICRHCGQTYCNRDNHSLLYVVLVCGLSTMAVPTFFMISGFLFFSGEATGKRLKRQVYRILKLYLVWVIIYMPFIIRNLIIEGHSFKSGTISFFQNLFFSSPIYHLWYLPALVVALPVVYLIGKRVSNKWMVGMAGCLFAVALLNAPYHGLTPSDTLDGIRTAYTKIFITTRNGIFVGVPFVTVGKIMADKSKELKLLWSSKKHLIIILDIAVIMLIMLEAVLLNNWKPREINDVILMDIFSVMLFITFVNVRSPVVRGLDRTASTVIYCMHLLVISGVTLMTRLTGLHMGVFTKSVCVILISVICGYAVSYLKTKWKAIGFFV